jgi:hypothetical protein
VRTCASFNFVELESTKQLMQDRSKVSTKELETCRVKFEAKD